MKKANNLEFLTFGDGTAIICETDDYGKPVRKDSKRYYFGNRTVGIKRYFSARQNDIEINKVIHIHKNEKITTANVAIINNTVFDIEQVQHFDDTKPKCTVLSLSQRGLYEGVDDGVS